LLARIVDADTAQCSDHNFPFRRKAESGDFVIRERAAVGFGVQEAGIFSGGDVDPVQPPQRPDPHFVSGTQIGGCLVVFSDIDSRQDPGQGQSLALDVPDLEEVSAQGDPCGSVLFHILDPGHEAGV
jgi:hypothetical protein